MSERYPYVLVRRNKTASVTYVDLELAAKTMGLATEEVEWALEAHGRCDTERHILIPLDFVP